MLWCCDIWCSHKHSIAMELCTNKFVLERISGRSSKIIRLHVGVYDVGRSLTARIIIPSKFCSRKHCRLNVDCDSVCIDIEVSLTNLFVHIMLNNKLPFHFIYWRREKGRLAEFMWMINDSHAVKSHWVQMIWLVSAIRRNCQQRLWIITGNCFTFTNWDASPLKKYRISIMTI